MIYVTKHAIERAEERLRTSDPAIIEKFAIEAMENGKHQIAFAGPNNNVQRNHYFHRNAVFVFDEHNVTLLTLIVKESNFSRKQYLSA